jgi:hypothetical protein
MRHGISSGMHAACDALRGSLDRILNTAGN